MMILEVLKLTGLTRKAVEYYVEQGLIFPQTKENGYREFTEEDVSRLERIAAYRKLGAGVAQIREILSGNERTALSKLLMQKTIDAQLEQKKRDLLSMLAKGHSLEEISPQLRALDAQESIAVRLMDAFPGYFGQYVSLHFSHFLDAPIENADQLQAYETIVRWLDGLAPLDLSEDLKEFLEETTRHMDVQLMDDMSAAVRAASENPQSYLSEHEDAIRAYLAVKDTEAYKASPAARLMEHMKNFQQQSGYIDIFLPAMERLSPAYAAYRDQMEAANKVFRQIFENQ